MQRLIALALSTHPLPSLGVTAIAVVLAVGIGVGSADGHGAGPWRVVLLGLAILAGQFSVGLSNDWLDAARDRAAGRTDKPVARGEVSTRVARNAAFATAAAGLLLTVPLGWPATATHAVFMAAGWAYNLGLKSTVLSPLPYLVGFGALPVIVGFALPQPAWVSPWAIAGGAVLGLAAHLANVLPDLADDAATGVRGLPHRLGAKTSGILIALAIATASALVVLGPGPPPAHLTVGLALGVALAAACAALVLTGRAARALFPLIIAGVLVIVVLLAISGSRLLA